MEAYPTECNVCFEMITSTEDLQAHFSRHLIGCIVLAKNIPQLHGVCESLDDYIESRSRCRTAEAAPVPQRQEDGLRCLDQGCRKLFTRLSDLERHSYTHIPWGRECGKCAHPHPWASTYTRHRCMGVSPDKDEVLRRQNYVKETLKGRVTHIPSARRRPRRNCEPKTPSLGISPQPDQRGGVTVQEEESNNALVQTPQMASIPSPEPVVSVQSTSASSHGVSGTLGLWDHLIGTDISGVMQGMSEEMWLASMSQGHR